MRRALAAAAAVLVLAACGGGGSEAEGVLDDAEAHLADVRSGDFSLSLEGTAEAEGERTDPVGFRVKGPFEFPQEDAYPILDITYERLRGEDSNENTFRSDGTSAWVIDGSAVTPVALNRMQGLRQGEGVAGAVPDLDLASWFEDPKLDGDTVTGEVDVVELLGDLQRIAAEIDGNQAEDTLDGDAAERLRKVVRSSSIELRTAGDDHEFRSLEATIDFGGEIPEAVDSALVTYAAPRLVLRITYAPLDGPLEVERPGGQ